MEITRLDTNYLGVPNCTSSFVVRGRDGVVLVECGCAVAYDTICAQLFAMGIAPRTLAGLVVTHIHLDHAGSAGHFAREGVPVYVHPRGARHLIEPARLIAGSRAVHGARYDAYFGDPLPIDPSLVRAIEDNETIALAGLSFRAIETLGHARHHHAWIVGRVGEPPDVVFTGDVLGMILPDSEFISIPVPPSDIDIPAWQASMRRLRAEAPSLRAFLTHGPEQTLGAHLDRFALRMNEELPFLAALVQAVERGELSTVHASQHYWEFLLPRAQQGGVSASLCQALLGESFRAMNLAGIKEALARGLFYPSVE